MTIVHRYNTLLQYSPANKFKYYYWFRYFSNGLENIRPLTGKYLTIPKIGNNSRKPYNSYAYSAKKIIMCVRSKSNSNSVRYRLILLRIDGKSSTNGILLQNGVERKSIRFVDVFIDSRFDSNIIELEKVEIASSLIWLSAITKALKRYILCLFLFA